MGGTLRETEEVEGRDGFPKERLGWGSNWVLAIRLLSLATRLRSASFSLCICFFVGWLLLPRKSDQLFQSSLYTSWGLAGMFTGRCGHDLNFSAEGIL